MGRKNLLSKDFIENAKQANLIDFMLTHHPESIINHYGIRDKEHDSLVLFPHSYCRFSTGEVQDSITYLEKYQGYQWRSSVIALNEFHTENYDKPETPAFDYGIPKNGKGFYKPVDTYRNDIIRKYLHKDRNISLNTIDSLIHADKIYAATTPAFGENFVCFSNKETDFYCLRNTSAEGFPKLQYTKKQCEFWWFSPLEFDCMKDIHTFIQCGSKHFSEDYPIYICESPIDAISLYELTKAPGIYAAMGGLKMTTARNIISTFKMDNKYRKAIIATDNDLAGIRFANSFPDEIPHDIKTPVHKDWNEDLLALR
jgi:hypothetical protein